MNEVRQAVKKIAISAILPGLILLFAAAPGFGVSKETIQMMTQLDSLQQEVQTLQRTVDTQTAVIKTLLQQTSASVDSMKAIIAKMQEAEQRNLAATSNRFDGMTQEIQQLSANLDQANGQLSKLSDQVAQTQKILQTLNVPATPAAPAAGTAGAPAAGAPGATSGGAAADAAGQPQAAAPSAPPVPDPQTLYRSAYGDYTQGQYQLAVQGFQQYLQDYGDTDLASNAQFYIGDSYYAQKDYKTAIQEYNKCIQQYPKGNKVAAARLKKAYALLALGQRTAGEHELSLLVRTNPGAHEADLAKERLRRLRLEARAGRR
ncbi:MAG: outer membrane protein assembly factor BamD [Acidobacteriota bacterium]|nr:outer membrane protein assembly factor BamD [Acidobacteriota bacterium]